MSSAGRVGRGPRPPRPPAVSLPDPLEEGRPPIDGGTADGLVLRGLDLAGRHLGAVRLLECALLDVVVDGARARPRVSGCSLERLSAVGADLSGSTWADVEVLDARAGALRLVGARLDRVRAERVRLDGAVLREAHLVDVTLLGCDLRGADLSGARLQRVSLAGCDLAGADLSGARCEDVDLRGAALAGLRGADGLRGAAVDAAQLGELAPALAEHVGLRVL